MEDMFTDTRSTFRVDALDWRSMAILAPHGELDVSVQQTLLAEMDWLLAKRPVVLAVDLRGLTFMDSSGVHALISTGRRCQEQRPALLRDPRRPPDRPIAEGVRSRRLLRDGHRARSAARRRVHGRAPGSEPTPSRRVHSDRGGADLGRVPTPPGDARERLLTAAYELFARQGVQAVGVDAIIERSGVARQTMYRHFGSKQDLVLAFLERREELWTYGWLAGRGRGGGPTDPRRAAAGDLRRVRRVVSDARASRAARSST